MSVDADLVRGMFLGHKYQGEEGENYGGKFFFHSINIVHGQRKALSSFWVSHQGKGFAHFLSLRLESFTWWAYFKHTHISLRTSHAHGFLCFPCHMFVPRLWTLMLWNYNPNQMLSFISFLAHGVKHSNREATKILSWQGRCHDHEHDFLRWVLSFVRQMCWSLWFPQI